MKSDLIHSLTDTFEAHAQQAENGVEFWLARDLQFLLGYRKWDNFLNVISKAKTACEVSGHNVSDHFPDIGKMVDLGSGSQREDKATRKNIPTAEYQSVMAKDEQNPVRVALPEFAKLQTDMYTFERFSIHVAANLYRKSPLSIHIEKRTEVG